MSGYLLVTCELSPSQEEQLTVVLGTWPALGCQVEDLSPEAVQVTVYLLESQAGAVPAVVADLRALGAQRLVVGELEEADWLAEYRAQVTPRAVGRRFWVDPHPQAPTPAPPGRIHLLIEPRQAFGTGSHESTALVLQVLERLPLQGKAVLDVGTGSSILALAAAALGAGPVVGFDIDLDAVCVARQTVQAQLRSLAVGLFAGPIAALAARRRFDVILANLLPAQLEPLLRPMAALLTPQGELVVSGLLVGQRPGLERELARAGLAVAEALTLGEWAALRCRLGGPGA